MKRIKKLSVRSVNPNADIIDQPCVNLGSSIRDQMYHGIDSGNSTLISGEYDDDDNWDVDPACDMSTDRFELNVDSNALHSAPAEPPAAE